MIDTTRRIGFRLFDPILTVDGVVGSQSPSDIGAWPVTTPDRYQG
jgi:hypothetical protein